jgi:DNA-directed RNA polymerase specialized sigma24 family protein
MELLEEISIDLTVTPGAREMEDLYEQVFPRVAVFISKMGGSFDDARDIFHDALVIFYENSARKNIVIHTSEQAYILGIAKHLWVRKFNKQQYNVSFSSLESEISIPDDYFPDINSKRLLKVLEVAGRRCLDLLRAFYYQNLSVRKIADSLGYANEHSASVQKYKCIEKVRETIKAKSLAYDDFIQ